MTEKINIVFLGTGSAIPTAFRNHPAVLIQFKEENILIDCGEGTQRQFRKAHINPCKITKILITHWHGDHVLGLPGLLQTLMLNGYNKTLQIYGPKGTKKMLSLYLDLFTHRDKIKIQVHEIENSKFVDGKEFFLESEKMKHETPSLAYSFVLKERNRIDKSKLKKLKIENSPLIGEIAKGKTISFAGKKIHGKDLLYKEKQKKITIIMDTLQNSQAISLSKNSDLLICESTYSKDEQDLATQHFHLTSTDAATIAKKSNSKKLILTHLSQRYDTKEASQEILKQARHVFKNTDLVKDLDVVIV